MLLIIALALAVISGCITAGNYEQGRPVYTIAWAIITAILFTYYMIGIQS